MVIISQVAYIKSQPPAEMVGKRVVCLCADSIRNYMSKFLDDNWMEANGFSLVAAGDDANAAEVLYSCIR